jgi:predicted enzyme related to lactoylglutathione lyase
VFTAYGGSVITGAHLVQYSRDPDADRTFLRDVLGWPFVRAAGPDDPWLIFALPPGELGVHPTDAEASVSLYLMCDDLTSTMEELSSRGVVFSRDPEDQGWGVVTSIRLPSGAELGLYQPRHATAHDA